MLGLGMLVYVGEGGPPEIDIRENVTANFQKEGISLWGPVKAKIHKNTVTGQGNPNVIAKAMSSSGATHVSPAQ